MGRTNLSPIRYCPLWKWRWALVLKVLLNPTSGRDTSHSCVVVIHSSLGQRLIRHEWEVSFPDMGLSKTLRTKAQCHFRRGQYLIGERFVPPIIYIYIYKNEICVLFLTSPKILSQCGFWGSIYPRLHKKLVFWSNEHNYQKQTP